MKALRSSVAGSLESSDVLVSVSPRDDGNIEISVESIVYRQFGPRIRSVAEEAAAASGIEGGNGGRSPTGVLLECTL
ncbi:hypothetical protein MASR2M79_13480 [Aminivibrio sp.]